MIHPWSEYGLGSPGISPAPASQGVLRQSQGSLVTQAPTGGGPRKGLPIVTQCICWVLYAGLWAGLHPLGNKGLSPYSGTQESLTAAPGHQANGTWESHSEEPHLEQTAEAVTTTQV